MRVGVDLLSISRFARVARHERCLTWLFTEAELAEARGLSPRRSTERLAGRFCAKEATAKAIGRGFGQGLCWRDIEITGDRWGSPSVTLRAGAATTAAAASITAIELSLSHQADLVICVATATQEST
ncbi:holo-ACP synthase [Actinokineospora sp.]|uniref:holo-ACP synthase n=1 Tax=Actinokineospora sp. TaxID=1872133 RepID=UPI004037CD6A